jgi:hypothetical protein
VRWNVGVLERWSVGALVRWNVGSLVRWNVSQCLRRLIPFLEVRNQEFVRKRLSTQLTAAANLTLILGAQRSNEPTPQRTSQREPHVKLASN